MPVKDRRMQNEERKGKATLQTPSHYARGPARTRRRGFARPTRLRTAKVGIPARERNVRLGNTRSSQRGNRRRGNTSRRHRLASRNGHNRVVPTSEQLNAFVQILVQPLLFQEARKLHFR